MFYSVAMMAPSRDKVLLPAWREVEMLMAECCFACPYDICGTLTMAISSVRWGCHKYLQCDDCGCSGGGYYGYYGDGLVCHCVDVG